MQYKIIEKDGLETVADKILIYNKKKIYETI